MLASPPLFWGRYEYTMENSGTLYIVATPIGNLGDITLRALEILKSVAIIATEDTRHTKKLLTHYNIHTPMISCFEHNEQMRSEEIISYVRQGKDVALVSEAGTPVISDPGYRLISEAVNAGVHLVPIPGATAAISALSVSGLPTDKFFFVGFLPDKPGKRIKKIEEVMDSPATLIFYISKWKVEKTLQDMLTVLGNRRICYCRELTKLHEEIIRSDLQGLIDATKDKDIKGEITLIVAGKEKGNE